MAPQVRLELTTLRLTAECSAIELLRIIRGLWCGLLSVRRFACRLPALYAWLWRTPRLRGLLCRLAAPFSLMFESGKNFRSSRSPLDPGNFLLSQAVPSSVPSAFGGLTSVFGMGTGGALQLSSPETFRREASLSLPLPAPSKLHSNRVDPQTFTLPNLPSLPFALSTASALYRFLRFLRLLLDGFPFSDQALDRLVSPSSTPHSASTDDLSTSSSLRGLTCLKQWQSSSSGGLHA